MNSDNALADNVLADLPLIADPDADQEMGAEEAATIADEELKDCRLLLVRRAVTPVKLQNANGESPGGVVALLCTFQATPETRFTRVRLTLRLTAPVGARIMDLQPREQTGEPVKVTINREGKLGFNYEIVEAERGGSREVEYEQKHCALQGSGENTAFARWDFTEDPVRQNGVVREQTLALTLPVTGVVEASLSLSARLVRKGWRGGVDALRDLVLGTGTDERSYDLSFEIPAARPVEPAGFFVFTDGS